MVHKQSQPITNNHKQSQKKQTITNNYKQSQTITNNNKQSQTSQKHFCVHFCIVCSKCYSIKAR